MELNKEAILGNYQERIRRLALYEPLIMLQSKKNYKDQDGNVINLYDLGLLTLLFFFENRLIRNHEAGVEELSIFLNHMTHERIKINSSGFDKIARSLIETFRPPSGKRLSKTFYNWELNKEETIYFSILKAGKSDLAANKQYYELDEDGLELIFSTREYFSEYQLSINQMLLRKQLEKGEFASALRQIDEMNVNVETLKERMIRITNEINRNIISDKVFKRYKELIEDINTRLTREGKEFEALREFVIEAVKRLKHDMSDEKDRKIYSNALKVNKELELVHEKHNGLLNDSIKIKTNVLQAAKESLYYVGIEAFNFNKEIVSRAVSEPLSLETVKTLAKPFMMLEQARVWSPLSVFFPQRVLKQDDGETNYEYASVKDSDKTDEERAIEKVFEFIMDLCLKYLSKDGTLKLSDLIEHIKEDEDQRILESRHFYDFWMVLHQFSPVEIHFENEDKTHNILVEAVKLLKYHYKTIIVVENKNVLRINERFAINDMEMKLEALYEL